MKVAVLGGGHGAYATAADLALAGHAVRLWRRREEDLAPIRAAGGITLVAEGRQGKAKLERVTADLTEALAGAEVVIVPLPATTHGDLAVRLAKVLDARQIVLLTPGTFGSSHGPRIARGRPPALRLRGTGTLPTSRKTGPAAVAAQSGPPTCRPVFRPRARRSIACVRSFRRSALVATPWTQPSRTPAR